MEKWAEKLYNEHKNPIVKLPGIKKKFVRPENVNEKDDFLNYWNTYSEVLDVAKVERRLARSKVNWSNEEKLGVAETIYGPLLKTFGFENKKGRFLLPEEILFLVEKNRVELFWNNVPVSIEQGYMLFLQKKLCLLKYRSYKKLALQGIKLVDMNIHNNKQDKNKEPATKKRKTDEIDNSNVSSNNSNTNKFKDIFANLQKNGPQIDETSHEISYNYEIFLPTNSKIEGNNMQYKMITNQEFDPMLAFNQRNLPILTCFPTDGFPCFKIVSSQIPSLV